VSDKQAPEKRFKHAIGPAVHRILWEEWDPIGVRQLVDWPDDEYDGYVWPVIAVVMKAEPVEIIADYLDWAATENMGLSGGDREVVRSTHLDLARKLHALKPL
jgi:hypothetical protein